VLIVIAVLDGVVARLIVPAEKVLLPLLTVRLKTADASSVPAEVAAMARTATTRSRRARARRAIRAALRAVGVGGAVTVPPRRQRGKGSRRGTGSCPGRVVATRAPVRPGPGSGGLGFPGE